MSNGGQIKISVAVLQAIEPFKQMRKEIPEAGGILMGRFIKETKDIVVDGITTPMKGDVQSRYTFKRLSSLHQEILDAEWKKSKGTCNYLGEWHTHPEQDVEPSGVDRRDWKRKLKTDVFSSRYLYFLIAGTDGIKLWQGDRRTLEVTQLKRINS